MSAPASCPTCGSPPSAWVNRIVHSSAPMTRATTEAVAREVMVAVPTIKGGWDTAYKIAEHLEREALSAPHTGRDELSGNPGELNAPPMGAELSAEDRKWLEWTLKRGLPVGHCGESTSEAISRGRAEDRVDRVLGALAQPGSDGAFVAREPTPELMAEFANIDGPWCRGQMNCDDVWTRLLEAQIEGTAREASTPAIREGGET